MGSPAISKGSRARAIAAASAFVLLAFGALVLVQSRSAGPAATAGSGEAGVRSSTAVGAAVEGPPPGMTAAPVADARDAALSGTPNARFGWGSGPGNIGKPGAGEGHGETPFRLGVGADGTAYLLDGENGRVVRVLADGGAASDVRLPVKDPLDVAVTKDGDLALLSRTERGGRVTVAGPDGRPRAALDVPEDVAGKARSVVVVGKDVYVESRSGEHRRVGDVSGVVDPSPAIAPGSPTRDGRAFVTAILPSPESTEVHVFVIDRATKLQRWSRLVRPALAVEGIVLADTDASGEVYLLVTGPPRNGGQDVRAELLCLGAEHGEVVGSVMLAVDVGAEAITDAKALDAGGIVFTVASRSGLRVERQDCH